MTNPYRAPEMDPHIPISDLPPREPTRIDDDVIRQPWTMAALLIAVALIITGLLFWARPMVRPELSSTRQFDAACSGDQLTCVRGRRGAPPERGFSCRDYEIRKSSFLAFPPFVAAVIQRGIRPPPVHVLAELLGSRYLTRLSPCPGERQRGHGCRSHASWPCRPFFA